ncbi:choice-of-anchor Q domain-containing protein [Dokdonella sp.]|uniref:choice-of-anchor Q domain-containing protein n=1 Tax=Dokdonella sp. TaxID=2291710 RepID=UPI002F41074C
MNAPTTPTRRLLAASILLAAAGDAAATNAVVSPPNCNEAGFAAALAAVDGSGSGTITFNCGTATITFTNYKTIANDVVIDGGNAITFDGGNTSALFQVFASANATLKGLTLQHAEFNQSHALENFGALKLDHVRVQTNVSAGPVVANSGTLRVRWSTFSGNQNTATAIGGDGGVIANDGGDASVESSTFTGNSTGRYGGAIYSNSTLDVLDSTFTGNATTGMGSGGGAIYQAGSGTSTVEYATIVGNTGQAFGGGLYNDGAGSATLVVSRSIMANNTNGNCDGVLTSGGYNVWFGATSCPFAAPGDGAGDPMLGALANNGGPTQTMLPGAGSAAINRVPNAQCAQPYDQRGASRPGGVIGNGSCDSGAVEVSGTLDLIFYDGFE